MHAPAPSHIFANSAAILRSSVTPVRNFTEMRFPLFTQAAITRSASGISSSSALPSPLRTILGMGQPMLISIRSKGASASLSHAVRMIVGSFPKICTALGDSAPQSNSFSVSSLP